MDAVEFLARYFAQFNTNPDDLAAALDELKRRTQSVEKSAESLQAQIDTKLTTVTDSGILGALTPEQRPTIEPTGNPDELSVNFGYGDHWEFFTAGRQVIVPNGLVQVVRPPDPMYEWIGSTNGDGIGDPPRRVLHSRQKWVGAYEVRANGSVATPGTYEFDNDSGEFIVHVEDYPAWTDFAIVGTTTNLWASTLCVRWSNDPANVVGELVCYPGFTRYMDHSLLDFNIVPANSAQLAVIYDLRSTVEEIRQSQINAEYTQRHGSASTTAGIDRHRHTGFTGDGQPVVLTIRAEAAEAIPEYHAVALDTSGKAVLASNSSSARWKYAGLSLAQYDPGETAVIQIGGEVENDAWSWNPAAHPYIYIADSGELQQASPLEGLIHQIGMVVSPTKIYMLKNVRLIA